MFSTMSAFLMYLVSLFTFGVVPAQPVVVGDQPQVVTTTDAGDDLDAAPQCCPLADETATDESLDQADSQTPDDVDVQALEEVGNQPDAAEEFFLPAVSSDPYAWIWKLSQPLVNAFTAPGQDAVDDLVAAIFRPTGASATAPADTTAADEESELLIVPRTFLLAGQYPPCIDPVEFDMFDAWLATPVT